MAHMSIPADASTQHKQTSSTQHLDASMRAARRGMTDGRRQETHLNVPVLGRGKVDCFHVVWGRLAKVFLRDQVPHARFDS